MNLLLIFSSVLCDAHEPAADIEQCTCDAHEPVADIQQCSV